MNEDQLPQRAVSSEFRNGPTPENGTPIHTRNTSIAAVIPAHVDDVSRAVEDVLQSDVGRQWN